MKYLQKCSKFFGTASLSVSGIVGDRRHRHHLPFGTSAELLYFAVLVPSTVREEGRGERKGSVGPEIMVERGAKKRERERERGKKTRTRVETGKNRRGKNKKHSWKSNLF